VFFLGYLGMIFRKEFEVVLTERNPILVDKATQLAEELAHPTVHVSGKWW
jgi:hypothetical protein